MPTLNPALRPFWEARADTKVLKGGRASSKTWDAAGFAIFLAQRCTVKFLCMRQFQNKIDQSVYAILVSRINEFGLSREFDIQKTVITHKLTGSSFHFYGIRRNIEEIKGFEGADIGWIEEGEGLTAEQCKIIEPTLRKEGAHCWILYNPRFVADFVEKFRHDPDNGVIVRQINYDENPFLTQTMLRKIAKMKAEDPDEYEHIYKGKPLSDDERTIIKRKFVEAAVGAHIKLGIEPAGRKRLGFDVADDGSDLNALSYFHGIVALWGENWKGQEDELLKSCTRTYNHAIRLDADVNYDSIGVGAHAGAKFNELNEVREVEELDGRVSYKKFNAGAKVIDPDGYYIDTPDEKITNRDFFSNLKAQAWWLVADRFRNTYNALQVHDQGGDWRTFYTEDELIAIDPHYPGLQDLITQLSTPRRDFDQAGRVKVESKKDLKAREVDSPNDADAFIMGQAPEEADHFADLLEMALNQ